MLIREPPIHKSKHVFPQDESGPPNLQESSNKTTEYPLPCSKKNERILKYDEKILDPFP